METFELWSYDVEGLEQFAEHTYLKCPERNAYFDCWGGHESEDQGSGVLRFSCKGRYDVASCYRRPAFGRPDTAGIGVYGINGVCHQTANLFLCSTGRVITLKDGVKGYGASVLAYGVHGDVAPFGGPLQPVFYEVWKMTVYNPCYQEAMTPAPDAGHLLLREIRDTRRSLLKLGGKMNHRELIHREASLVARQALPDLDAGSFKDIHMDFLKEKTAIIRKGIKGEPLANKLNEIAAGFQRSLAERIGPASFERLTGLKPGETVMLVDPRLAAGQK